MTLRGRLLTYSLGQVAALGLLSLAVGLFIRARVLPILDDHLVSKAQVTLLRLASRLDMALESSMPDMAGAALAEAARDADLIGAEVRGRTGALLAAVGDRNLPEVASEPGARIQVRDLGDALGAKVSIEIEGYSLGTATAVFSKAHQRALVAWMVVCAVALSIAFFVAVMIAFRFSRSFVGPIHRMIRFSNRLKEGGLSERVAASAREGELSQLAADLNAMAEALENRDAALALRSRELEESLAKLRATQEELLRSTRLASVGEMAGRTAHEVLNPMTSIHCRLTKMQHHETEAMAPNLETLRDIAGAWRAAYQEGGIEGLFRSLSQPALEPGGPLLLAEDLDNLDGIAVYLAESHRERTADVQFLLKESDRVVHIVDGMRSLTRASGTRSRARMDELLRESVEAVADFAAQSQVKLRLDSDPTAEVMVDRYEFVQVLTNLLRNALLAIEERNGHQGGQVTIATAVDQEKVSVRVEDDGCGIVAEHLPLLFEAYFTTRPSSDGTGLGLSIARRLARGFGGELRLERTAVGRGATFLLEIPLAEPAPGPAEALVLAQ